MLGSTGEWDVTNECSDVSRCFLRKLGPYGKSNGSEELSPRVEVQRLRQALRRSLLDELHASGHIHLHA